MGLHYRGEKTKRARTIKIFKILLWKLFIFYIILNRLLSRRNGWIAQLARAIGSYPVGRRFESASSYQTNITHQLMGFYFIWQYIKHAKERALKIKKL